ncbi:phenylacrylic acid decarboxylase [Moniliophthora roreri MCA 2997]|uniref:Flavin prenyltransferase PAD1, mitochondrial n=1 Tax=Moniliophthora roreri (strain MCA 2997) TaxID=1381753 RepID=V2W4S9_MONRO|nr:phenylacrylic acid decarboxylase [Moniliophthora roreri MCA 2997]KAI3614540.1 phenylacrylic acid decarboxylase [Moniliophthora roreri]
MLSLKHTSSAFISRPYPIPGRKFRLASRACAFSSSTRHSSPPSDALVSQIIRPKRLIVGITGATGSLFSIRLLQVLRTLDIETHLVMSKWALPTMKYEVPNVTEADVRSLATHNYTYKDMSAPPSSGSFLHDGMVIVPCSMKTLAAIRIGFCDDLISRSADVCLKEGRKLLIVPRETPLSDIHLENMLYLKRAGATIFPPVPAFYIRPKSIEDLVDQTVGRMLDQLGIHTSDLSRWNGFQKP